MPRRKKINGGSPFTGTKTGVGTCVYQDTVIVEANTTDPSGDLRLTPNQLTPSLQAGRQVVPQWAKIEMMPTLFNSGDASTADVVQLQVGAIDTVVDDTVGVTVASGPFKMCSNVNPTQFTVDFRKLGKLSPTILRIRDDANNAPCLYIGYKPFDLTDARYMEFRITTQWLLFPQTQPTVITNPSRKEE